MNDAPKIIATAGRNRRTLAASVILALTVGGVVYLQSPASLSQTVGQDSVVMGLVSPNLHVGDRSVVIGPTDSQGNVRFQSTMAVGQGAYAGPGSIAIGAGAGAGMRPYATTSPDTVGSNATGGNDRK